MELNNSKAYLRELFNAKFVSDILDAGSDDEEQVIDDFLEDSLALQSQRYLNDRLCVQKSHGMVSELLPNYDEKRFKNITRVSRTAFAKLLDMLKDHEVFQTVNQVPVSIQLLSTLHRFGTFGNSAGVMQLARKFGIGDGGSLTNCTKRVIKALLSLEKDWIKWPSKDERRDIGDSMTGELFPFCIGFLDGTQIPLAGAPEDDPVSYYNRKGFYSLNVQLIVDPAKRIRAYHIGQPGKVHDSKVFSLMDVCKNPSKYFEDEDYILCDSAYRLTSHTIKPYRKSNALTKDQERFNFHLSSKRVAVEHVNGVLKNRFASLKGLRMKINRKSGHPYACEWTAACLILYNMLLDSDPWADRDQDDDDDDEDDAQDNEDLGVHKRDALFKYFLDNK